MAIFQLTYVVVPIGGIIYGTLKEKQFRASVCIKYYQASNGYFLTDIMY